MAVRFCLRPPVWYNQQMEEPLKQCAGCEEFFPISSFPRKTDTTRHGRCAPCKNTYQRANYRKGGAARVQSIVALNKGYKRRLQERVVEYLRVHPCVDCGETDPIVLEFDH